MKFKVNDRVLYVPDYAMAAGMTEENPDAEKGTVTAIAAGYLFVLIDGETYPRGIQAKNLVKLSSVHSE